MVNNRTLLSTKEKENLLIIILVFLLSLSWWAILQLLFLFGHVTQWCFDFWDFFGQCFPSRIEKKYSVEKFLAFFQNFTSFSRKNILWEKFVTYIDTGFSFLALFSAVFYILNSSSSFWGVFFTKFQPEKCDFRPIQTWNDISWRKWPKYPRFWGEKTSISPDWWMDHFFQNFDIYCKAKGSKKKKRISGWSSLWLHKFGKKITTWESFLQLCH